MEYIMIYYYNPISFFFYSLLSVASIVLQQQEIHYVVCIRNKA